MKLAKVIQTYVTFKRSTGMHFHSEDCLLRAFCRAAGGVDISNVKPAAVQAFLDGKGPVTAVWGLKFRVLRSFYRFAISRGFATHSPLQRACRSCRRRSCHTSTQLRNCGVWSPQPM